MITREWFETNLPHNDALRDTVIRALRASGDVFSENLTDSCLSWLARLTEKDMHSYNTQSSVNALGGYTYPVSFDGLGYKDSAHYLTGQGYPTGSICWYVRIACGFHVYTCSPSPELALMRGVIVAQAALLWREEPASTRLPLEDYVMLVMRQS